MNFRFALILGTIYQAHSEENVTSSNEKSSIVSLDSGDYLSHEQGERDKFDVIPYQFWTKGESRGHNSGYGVADGDDYVVFLNADNKFLGCMDNLWLIPSPLSYYCSATAKSEPTPDTKFKMEVDATGKISLRSYYGGELTEKNGSLITVYTRTKKKNFYWTVSTTNSEKGFGVEGNNLLALKNPEGYWLDGKTWNFSSRYSSESTKFHGWKIPERWEIEKIDFDINNIENLSSTPKTIGTMTTTNRSSVSHKQSFTFSDLVAQTETWSNSVGAGIEVGTSFKAGIPFIAKGQIHVTISASFEHIWGKTTYKEIKYENTIDCVAPPYTEVRCDYICTRSEIDVPYVMLLSRYKGNQQKRISGIWKGVQTSKDHADKVVLRTFPHLLR